MKCVTVYVKGVEAGVLAKFRQGGYEFRYMIIMERTIPPKKQVKVAANAQIIVHPRILRNA